jgi:hypothetical protein
MQWYAHTGRGREQLSMRFGVLMPHLNERQRRLLATVNCDPASPDSFQ